MKNKTPKFFDGLPELLHKTKVGAELTAYTLTAFGFGWSVGHIIGIFVRELSK